MHEKKKRFLLFRHFENSSGTEKAKAYGSDFKDKLASIPFYGGYNPLAIMNHESPPGS